MNLRMAPESFATYAAGTSDPRFTEWLRRQSEAAWACMITHRFTRDIAADALELDVFKRYLVYEHAFVETTVSIFGYALVRAPSITEQTRLVEVLRGLTSDQEGYFTRVFEALGMPEACRREPVLPPAVQAFREGMLGAAAHGAYEDILAAMLAAEWMYLTWSREAQRSNPRDSFPAEWIALHIAPRFENQVTWMREQLDRLGPMLAPFRQHRAADIFRRTLELEVDFHDAPYAEP